VGGSSDAPFGPLDPWRAIAAAADRRTRTGDAVGPAEAIDGHRSLARFLSPLDAPGGPPRAVAPGVPADLCLLDLPLARALAEPSSDGVRATWIAGALVHGDG
jgi:predicted amidohydrolase YtcJ